MIPSVDLHDTSVKVVVLLVKDVLFVVICFFSFFSISFVIALISPLTRVRSSLELPVELNDFIGVQIADILKLILLFGLLWLMNPESEIISLKLALFVGSVLLFAPANGPNLVHFGSLGGGNHL